MMDKPRSPYQEVTSPENAEIHGTLRDRTWRGLQTLRARERFMRATGYDWAADALQDFNHGILRTSGSIDGKHRDSTTQAVQGQKPPPMALIAAPATPPGQELNGHAKAVKF